jgi:hypothetical protein
VHSGRVDRPPASYSRGPGFESLRSAQTNSGIVPAQFCDEPTMRVKLSLCLIIEAPCHEDVWGSGGVSSPFLTSILDGSEWSASRSGYFIPVPIGYGRWVDLRIGLDAVV